MIHYRLPLLSDFKKTGSEKNTALIILKNNRGMQVAFTNYGARIVSIIVPDKQGQLRDVVLGFNTIEDYFSADEIYHGATIGRFANRIQQGIFEINGTSYSIKPNNGLNALHGGANGFQSKIWDRRLQNPNGVTFYYTSPDGEEGFPGNLTVSVDYLLTESNELKISFRAKSDQDTIINLTNHAYFNLNGEGSDNVSDHTINIFADQYIPIDSNQIPTGEMVPVADTPFDFRKPKVLFKDIDQNHLQLNNGGGGYDHTFVLDQNVTSGQSVAASAYAKDSGILLEVLTTEPGIQFYTGNALNGKDKGKSGRSYARQHAFCFETQHFPDSPNNPSFPSTILKAGDTYQSQTTYRFNVLK